MSKIGYDDTPFLPNAPYRVHDGTRPQPPVVTPGAYGEPPSDAVVLFDGKDLSGWVSARDGGEAKWKVENGYMEVVPGTGDIETKEHFGDCQLHVEWMASVEATGESQGRSNSGVFLMGRYEIQVLDCYHNPTYPDGTTAAIYGQYPPLVNACRPPGEWQTYDIIWEAPRFDGETLVKPAYVTVLFNGIVVHHRTELIGPTTHRAILPYQPHPPTGPLRLQDHGDPVRFRNIWYRPLKGYDE
ncbi:MAG: DUF1080 domain-containing protein [Abditibacteriales bacterium]|nr:DUF1080 domain-containing protein [Abditibacteriales bacterium]MDW8366192.1 DUF1080 domain-containing protein [Abditibacteriales bacterium]